MMMSEFMDGQLIRAALVSLILCLLISCGLVWGSVYFKDSMDQAFRRHNAVFQANASQYLAVDEEEKMIEEYLPAFIESYNNGEIGRERRLDWIESLRSTGVNLKLPSLNYSLSSRGHYAPEFQLDMGNYGFFKSEMTLQVQLLHEGDLFSFFSSLEERVRGSFRIVDCGLVNNIADKNLADINSPNIQVDCMLEWITLNMADGTEIKVES